MGTNCSTDGQVTKCCPSSDRDTLTGDAQLAVIERVDDGMSSAASNDCMETDNKVQLTWLGSWKAYAVRLPSGGVLGLIRCRVPHLPFRFQVEFLRG
jgi:hypothetical protein